MGLLALGVVMAIVFRHDISHQLALAEGRHIVASHKAELLDLSAYYDMAASQFEQTKGSHFPEWAYVPRGFETFAHVPLQIGGIKCLWGAGNAKAGMSFDEEVTGIPMNREFETLYVYHCTFFGAPNKTPVYDLVFRYEDGSSMTNRMLYGVDVLDWFGSGGPSGSNSRLAWHGVYSSGGKTQPLRFCLTALENPYPSIEVTSIDLYSCKNISAGCVLAMTPGKSGLMH